MQSADFLPDSSKSLLYCRIVREDREVFGVSLSRVREMALNTHKFRLGQTVYFTAKPLGHMTANGSYQIVKLLPSDGDEHQYRIKSTNEAFERVAKESQLDRSR
jgi:hypothetical protein